MYSLGLYYLNSFIIPVHCFFLVLVKSRNVAIRKTVCGSLMVVDDYMMQDFVY